MSPTTVVCTFFLLFDSKRGFSSSVEELVFRTDSTIQSKTVKNRRKAEKKRKRLEKRLSESSQDDSGIASSFEDSSPWQLGGGVINTNVVDRLLIFRRG